MKRQYQVVHESYQWKAFGFTDKNIVFGVYDTSDGGTTDGEMRMMWEKIREQELPKLECGHDAFEVLKSFEDVLNKLAELNGKPFSTKDFISLLDLCGFEDVTIYEQPSIL